MEGGHTIFRLSNSSTFKASPGQTWNIRYGDGSTASGIVGIDDIDLGGLKIRGQAVELAAHLSESFFADSSDGLLGLGFVRLCLMRSLSTVDTNIYRTQSILCDLTQCILQSRI
jgi:hypothetical protein